MSRDWQKDMMECEMMRTKVTSFLPEIGIYWLQQYKELQEECDEWKTLAESLNGDIRIANEEIAKINCDYYADKQRFVVQRRELEESKAREKKLREAMEETINEALTLEDAITFLNDVLASLYPKEETK